MIFYFKKILAQLKNNFHVQFYGNFFNFFKIPNLQCIFSKILHLYLNKYLEHKNYDIKKLFVVKVTCIFWLINVNIN
jgi:hypothetical protein